MRACVIYKYMILICDLCTMKFLSLKMEKKTESKKAQKYREPQEILDLGCLFEAVCIPKIAGSICKTSKALRFRGLHCVNVNCELAVMINH